MPTSIRNTECDYCQFGISSKRPPDNVCLLPKEIEHHDVMLIADQPTMSDDKYGKIFSGKGLADIKQKLEDMGLDVYATYAIKCVKPNKDTKAKPKDAKICGFGCAPKKGAEVVGGYLQEEIKRVKPKHIICMGANTFVATTGKAVGFADLKSNRYFDERLQAHVYATDHHVSAMFNVTVKDALYADLDRFHGWMTKGAKPFEPPLHVASTLKSLRMMQTMIREAGGIVAVDTETQGLNQYDPTKTVRCIQFCWDEDFGGVFVPLDLEDDCYYTQKHHQHNYWQGDETLDEAILIIREILLESRIVWHGGKFDRIWLNQWGKRRFGKAIKAPNIYMDTMHMAHALDENRPLKLKHLITTELGFATYDIDDKLTKDLDILIPYAARDTVASLMLAKKYGDVLADESFYKLKKLYTKITRRADKLFTKMELRGWPVDGERAEDCKVVIEDLIEKTLRRMIKYLKPYREDMYILGLIDNYDAENDEFSPIDPKIFASTQKLAKLLFEVLDFKPSTDKKLALTKGGALSTNADALIHLKGERFIDLMFEWRGLFKALSTYVEPMIRAANGRGRLSTSYKLTGTVTGRTASGKEAKQSKRQGTGKAEGMNLQNLLYTFGIRNCIKAREGWSILECDLSQIELRIAGGISQDPLFIKAYNEGWDIHSIRAMRVTGVTQEEWDALPPEEKKERRQKAKAVNFGFLYGMQAPTFQQYALVDYGVHFTMKECAAIRKQFFDDHTALPGWYVKQEEECKKFGYVESPSGRRRHLPNITLNPESSKDARSKYNEAIRMAINTPVQGFGSDWKLMSMLETDQKVSKLFKGRAYLFGEIHDSILLEVRNDVLEDVAKMVLRIMAHPSILDELGIEFTIPVLAEAKAGASLGECKDLKVDWQAAA